MGDIVHGFRTESDGNSRVFQVDGGGEGRYALGAFGRQILFKQGRCLAHSYSKYK